MTLIALEEHLIPAELVDQVWPKRSASGAVLPRLTEVGEQRLRVMDDAGIDLQVLSVTAPGSQQVPVERAADLSRALNDRCAEVVAAHPDRFNALASLPTQDPAAAIIEAKRAITELGLCGVVINGHTQGRFLDSAEFDEMLGAIEELDVPVYLHPTYPPAQVADVYFGGLPTEIGSALATAAWGWHAETGLHVLRLAASGAFDRHPGLQIVVGHMGENLPFSLMRADAVLSGFNPGGPSVAEAVRSHVHITISGYTTTPPLFCALQVFGADRIMFAADYPFGDASAHAKFLADAPISPADREKIAHRNARRLFTL
ncbi:amidohydrolase family protein [Mycolicibacterium baixiangningiae]|uniref:amidohydrolase family protein n=1 Tax=Mycolicibacterium baixiangningiae TaxID=2761578 RepID=UPI001866EA58|nr:amidohydrolase family protein [Mycolicibacterium baixiangningiae]